jgi:hypothetical protein
MERLEIGEHAAGDRVNRVGQGEVLMYTRHVGHRLTIVPFSMEKSDF